MPLERLKEVPQFPHTIDEYELSKMEPTDAYIARNTSSLRRSTEWNNQTTLLINNAVVDQQEEIDSIKNEIASINARLDNWDRRYEVLKARITSPITIVSVVLFPIFLAVVPWILDRIFHK